MLFTNIIPTTELEEQVSDQIGKDLSLAELEFTAQRIAQYYRNQGWFVRVFLPQQDVTDGTIHIQVVESHFGGSNITGQDTRANLDAINSTITYGLKVGQPLSADKIERGLLIANDLHGVQANAVLQPGAQTGETQIGINVEDTPFFMGDIGFNNFGNKYTGRAQATGGISLNNITGYGDQLGLRVLASQGIRSGSLRYTTPLGYSGLNMSAYAFGMSYKLNGIYKKLNAKGNSKTLGLNFNYPLVRQSNRNLYLNVGYEHNRYKDYMLDDTTRQDRIDKAIIGLNGNYHDGIGGGGISWAGIQFSSGKLRIGDVFGAKILDEVTTKSHGNFTKVGLNIGRLQSMGSQWQLMFNLDGQIASKNLSSSEKFSLGGPYGIRAYPINEGTGDQGALLKLELQKNLGNGWQAIAFYDAGHIRQYKNTWNNWNAGSNRPNSYFLQGAGLGVNWQHKHWQLNASLAMPIGNNKGAINGKAIDGTKSKRVRGWINLSWLF